MNIRARVGTSKSNPVGKDLSTRLSLGKCSWEALFEMGKWETEGKENKGVL